MNELERYLAILQKISKGKDLTSDERKFAVTFVPTIDEERLAELKQKAAEKDLALSDTELSEYNKLLYQNLMASPSTRETLLEKAKETSKLKTAGVITDAMNAVIAAGDITQSVNQVNEARRLARQSRRPATPAPLTKDPLLNQAIFEAQQGTFDTAKRLAPAQLAILDQYLGDLNQARTASTGQAGTYGALAQVASTRRGRNLQQLTPMGDEIRAREQGRLDNLLQLRLGENQAIQQSQAQMYPYDLRQYQQEQESIGALGATGRQNLRQSIVNLGSQVPNYAAEMAVRRKFDKLKTIENAYNLEPNTLTDINKQTMENFNQRNRGWAQNPAELYGY